MVVHDEDDKTTILRRERVLLSFPGRHAGTYRADMEDGMALLPPLAANKLSMN
jgi:hypothetical protein